MGVISRGMVNKQLSFTGYLLCLCFHSISLISNTDYMYRLVELKSHSNEIGIMNTCMMIA